MPPSQACCSTSGAQSALGGSAGWLVLPAEHFVIAPPQQLLLSLTLGSLSNLGKEGALLARVFHTPARLSLLRGEHGDYPQGVAFFSNCEGFL